MHCQEECSWPHAEKTALKELNTFLERDQILLTLTVKWNLHEQGGQQVQMYLHIPFAGGGGGGKQQGSVSFPRHLAASLETQC